MASRPRQAEPRPAPRFYLVTPPVEDADAFAAELPAVLGAADVAAVLLRLADGDERSLINRVKTLAPFVQERGVAVLLDGHANLAARGGADGAHLSGIEEFSVALESLKPDRIAGAGGLASRHDVMVAAETGADYLMFGYRDRHQELPALQERVGWCAEVFELPCVAFAASENEIAPLIAAGADFIALDYIWRDPRGAAKALADTSASLRLPESAQ
jgi:thiamine-phosphate pyrophosphorylase